jgi:glycine/D-amino acid oxidase-like deaminating enzyme
VTAPDIVVVGNGVVGLWVATETARRVGGRVVVVGPATRTGAASPAAGAMLGCFGEVTRHTLTSEAGRARFALQLAAHEQWPAALGELGAHAADPLLVATDTYVVLNAVGGTLDSANLAAMVQALTEHGREHEVVDHVPGLDPLDTARPLRALRLPDEGVVHSGRLIAALEARAAASGVEIIDARVERIEHDGTRATGVVLSDSTRIGAGAVVLAAGAWTTPLLDTLPDPHAVQPVYSGSGIAYAAERVMGDRLTSAIRSVTRAGSCGLHALPLGGGVEYFGATNVIFGEPELRPHLGVCQFLAECAIDQIDRSASYSRIDELRIGNRPVPFDTFPLLGPGPIDDLWITSGGYRDGLHSAPEVARLASVSIHDAANQFPAMFSPTRHPLTTMSVDASIDDFVDQQIASAFEGGSRLSPFLDRSDLDRAFRPRALELYRRLGTTLQLAPDLITYLAVTRKHDHDVDRAAAYLRAVGS